MKNLLIMGGSYFAGRVLVELLLGQADYRVYVCNRGRVPLGYPGLTEIVCDRQDGRGLYHALPHLDWDAVVDFCAYAPLDVARLLNHMPKPPRHYIFISTTSIYQPSWDMPLLEDAPKLSGPQPELADYADYGFQKWLAEIKLREECEARQIAWTCLRPAIIYGRYNYAPRESYFFDLLVEGRPVVIPDPELPLFSFCWVADLARAVLRCLGEEKAFAQAFNLAGDELVSYRRLVNLLEAITGKTMSVVLMSPREIEAANIPLPFPLDHHLVYSGRKLERTLDFAFTPMLLGLRRTLEHYIAVRRQRKQREEIAQRRAEILVGRAVAAQTGG